MLMDSYTTNYCIGSARYRFSSNESDYPFLSLSSDRH